MITPDKMVFISYRRSTSKYLARLIFDRLRAAGYDAFLDVNTIDNGAFDSVILSQIGARPHFIVLISAGALERCKDEGDWLRREIEEAMRLGRNVVPLTEDGLDFMKETEHLVDNIRADFRRYNPVGLSHEYFDAAMDKLIRFLKKPVYGIQIANLPLAEQKEIEKRVAEIVASPAPTDEQLNAEYYYNRAYRNYSSTDIDNVIADCDEAIRLNPNFANAYCVRGVAHSDKQDYDAAITDFDKAISFNPEFAEAYNNRGEMYFVKGMYDTALNDFKMANKIKPASDIAIAGIAITNHILGNIVEARHLWKTLFAQNGLFRDVEWIRKEFNWAEPLVEEAKKLIAKL